MILGLYLKLMVQADTVIVRCRSEHISIIMIHTSKISI